MMNKKLYVGYHYNCCNQIERLFEVTAIDTIKETKQCSTELWLLQTVGRK